MKKLLIIFAENGRLKDSYPEFIDDTSKLLLIEPRIWFLNGKSVAEPIIDEKVKPEGPGILLVYDAHDDDAYDEEETKSLIAKISEAYGMLYVCYHIHTDDKWNSALKSLEHRHTRKPISRKHTEEPYFSLHAFHKGEKTLDDLTIHWHLEELFPILEKRAALVSRLDAAFERKTMAILAKPETDLLVEQCLFTDEEQMCYSAVKTELASMPDEEKWHHSLVAFRKAIMPEP